MIKIMVGDVREQLRMLADNSVHCVVTSPPYWGLRDYGAEGQIGLESAPAEFIATMVEVFEEVRRVLRQDGTCWVNMGDSFKNKSLVGMPWRLTLALIDAGWYLRRDIIWHKPNPMPESCLDRCTTAHEYIFMLTKSDRYFYDRDAIAEPCVWEGVSGETNGVTFGHGMDAGDRGRGRVKKPDGWDTGAGSHGTIHRQGREKGATVSARDNFRRENSKRAIAHVGQTVGTHRPDRKDTVPDGFRNKRSVWTMATHSFKEAHFATFPPELPEICIKAGCPIGGTVLDPFFGAGTTGLVADRLQRDCIGIELNPAYAEIARKRIQDDSPLLVDVRVAA